MPVPAVLVAATVSNHAVSSSPVLSNAADLPYRDRRDALASRVKALIASAAGGREVAMERDALLLDIARLQAETVAPYARLLAACKMDPRDARHPVELAAVPTDVFRFARVAIHGADRDVAVFRTSGTTSGQRGAHHFADLSLYDASARAWAKAMLFADVEQVRLISLIPPSAEAADSSLSYMVDRFADWFGAPSHEGGIWHAVAGGRPDAERLATCLDRARRDGLPVGLLGTSFAFVMAEDVLGERRFALPRGSRLMQTGGFKGRTREVEPTALRWALAQRYGVAETAIVAEYGMTELASQLYETTLVEPAGARVYRAPPWVRLEVVDPERLRPVPTGQVGILRIEDPANLDTAWALQTADLARQTGAQEILLLGRDPSAQPRGCSLAVEEMLAPGPTPSV